MITSIIENRNSEQAAQKIATSADPKKIEQQIMEVIPPSDWGETGMAISFLGRETCRPSHPQHEECVMSSVCEYYKQTKGGENS